MQTPIANHADNTSQLRMVVVLADANGNACPIHYASWKSRRVSRSVLSAEVYALSACFDYAYTLRKDLEFMLGKKIPLYLFTNSMSIFDAITKLSSTSEKRLLIDISSIRQAYILGKIQNMAHISSEHNLADPLTKRTNSPTLTTLLETGKLRHPINKWIIHRDSDFER